MDYIDRKDEVLTRPSYTLGTKANPYFSHLFSLPASRAKLEAITDTYLNEPLQSDRFSVLFDQVWISFNFYGESKSNDTLDQNKGWLSYAEVMIGYYVYDKGESGNEINLRFHMPFVYIGPATPDCAPVFPIIMGRECYGFPKNPSLIEYQPSTKKTARLHLYDYSSTYQNNRVRPVNALEIDNLYVPQRQFTEDDYYRSMIRDITQAAEFIAETPWQDVGPGERFEVDTRTARGRWNGRLALKKDVFLLTDLVAYKDFRDAKQPQESCYSAVVSTVLHGPAARYDVTGANIDFHALSRVSIWDELGCAKTSRGVSGYYHAGQLTYADPKDTTVWRPPSSFWSALLQLVQTHFWS